MEHEDTKLGRREGRILTLTLTRFRTLLRFPPPVIARNEAISWNGTQKTRNTQSGMEHGRHGLHRFLGGASLRGTKQSYTASSLRGTKQMYGYFAFTNN